MYIKICGYCGKQYTTRKNKQKYCSPDCQYNSLRVDRGTAVCKQCGKTFVVGRGCKGVYCSHKCSTDAIRVMEIERAKQRRCEREQKRLMYEELKQKYKQLKQRYYSAQNKLNHIKYCEICNKLFIANDTRQKFCCAKCKNKYNNKRKDKRIYKNGKPDLSISLTRLYMRDMGICQLCGKHIDFDCDSNSNNYPSIDHIKPIAKGGLHSWDNVHLACRGCNSAKSDKF